MAKKILKKNDELDNLILFIAMSQVQAYYLKDNPAYPEIKAMFNRWFNESKRLEEAFDRFYFSQRKLDNYEQTTFELAATVKKLMICENPEEMKQIINIMAKLPKTEEKPTPYKTIAEIG